MALTTSHPAEDLVGAEVVVGSLSQAQPLLLRWMTGDVVRVEAVD